MNLTLYCGKRIHIGFLDTVLEAKINTQYIGPFVNLWVKLVTVLQCQCAILLLCSKIYALIINIFKKLTFQGSKQTFVSIQLKFFRKAFGINVLKVAANLCCNSIKSCSTEIFQKLLLNLETAPIVCSDIFELRKEKTYNKALQVVFTFCKKIFTYSSLFIGSCQYFLMIIFISALFTKLKIQLTWDRVVNWESSYCNKMTHMYMTFFCSNWKYHRYARDADINTKYKHLQY